MHTTVFVCKRSIDLKINYFNIPRSGSSRGDRMRNEPMLVLRNLRQLVIQACNSYMDMFLACADVVWLEGSEDCRTCKVSTHCDLSYSEDRKKL